MKIIIFGASGTVGQPLLEQALDAGHDVTAFCRQPQRLPQQHPSLVKRAGDVYDLESVTQAISGQDAVLIVLGSGRQIRGTVRSEGTKNIIKAMESNGVKRLICQTTLGAGDSRENLNFFWKYIMFGGLLKAVYQDHLVQEDYVRASGLDWTIVRPGSFTDGDLTGQYQHGFSPEHKDLTLKISRADVADFLLKQLDSHRYLKKTPGLSY